MELGRVGVTMHTGGRPARSVTEVSMATVLVAVWRVIVLVVMAAREEGLETVTNVPLATPGLRRRGRRRRRESAKVSSTSYYIS